MVVSKEVFEEEQARRRFVTGQGPSTRYRFVALGSEHLPEIPSPRMAFCYHERPGAATPPPAEGTGVLS
jgi:hypothetical protein